MELASDAREFDVSPAWPAWVGALPALRTLASLDTAEVWRRASGLGISSVTDSTCRVRGRRS